jgi:shikimate kinase
VVLLGLPGAGKSTVGVLVAARLGWEFIDLDAVIERDAGRSVGEIFALEGEAGFRSREHRATIALVEETAGLGRRVVVSPGGGWVEDPSNLAALGGRFISVYLRVKPVVALGRLGESAASRPLIAGRNSGEQLAALLRRREMFYVQANHAVNTDSLSPAEVCDSIVALVSQFPSD